MPIKIHHGPNGSYKSSGAVWDDAVPAMKEGRVIITNVRGFTYERCIKLFPDLPDTFDVIFIDIETEEGMQKARTWFIWAPRDAFIIFDETQNIFLKKWTDKYLEQFDYPGGIDAAKAADRPNGWLDAWTRQRHWNWDIVLTTPNIKYIRDDIRQTCEMAYIHANLGVLGKAMKVLLNADYKESMHSAQDNRPSADGSIVAFRKIDKRVFELYDSTATGKHRDTFTGKSLLGSPKVLGLLAFTALFVGVIYANTGFSLFKNGLSSAPHGKPNSAASSPHQVGSVPAGGLAVNKPADAVATGPSPKSHDIGPFQGKNITIKAALYNEAKGVIYQFQIESDGSIFYQSSKDLFAAGYTIRSRGLCAADLVYDGQAQTVVCTGSRPAAGGAKRPEERSVASERQGQPQQAGISVTGIPYTPAPRTLL